MPAPSSQFISAKEFICVGVKQGKGSLVMLELGQLGGARDWLTRNRSCASHLRWSQPALGQTLSFGPPLTSLSTVYIIEFTVPWEDALEEAFEHKNLNYAEFTQLKLAAGPSKANQQPYF